MIVHDIIWYEMIWHDIIHDMMWYDTIWCDSDMIRFFDKLSIRCGVKYACRLYLHRIIFIVTDAFTSYKIAQFYSCDDVYQLVCYSDHVGSPRLDDMKSARVKLSSVICCLFKDLFCFCEYCVNQKRMDVQTYLASVGRRSSSSLS